MRFTPTSHFFTTKNDYSFLFSPLQRLTASQLTSEYPISPGGDTFHASAVMDVIIEDAATGDKYAVKMRRYTHPVGAGSLSLGSMSGSWVWTSTKEGRAITWAGAVVVGGETGDEVAGWLLDYFDHIPAEDASDVRLEQHRAQTLEEGDSIWVVYEGDFEVDSDAATTVDQFLVAAAAGEVSPALAINTAGTIAQYETSLTENTAGHGPRALALAIATETTVGAGIVRANLLLPQVYS